MCTRAAQSRGEWPGARRIFLLGREGGGREEVVGERVEEGGLRRVEAWEGRGRRVDAVGRADGRVGAGLGGRGDARVVCGFRRAVEEEGSGGGGIEIGCCCCC